MEQGTFRVLSGTCPLEEILASSQRPGDYIVHVEINAAGTFNEGKNLYPDVIEARIHVPDPRNKVTVDTAPLKTGG